MLTSDVSDYRMKRLIQFKVRLIPVFIRKEKKNHCQGIVQIYLYCCSRKDRCCVFPLAELDSFAILQAFVSSLYPCIHCLFFFSFFLFFFSFFFFLFCLKFMQNSQVNIFTRLDTWPQQVTLKVHIFPLFLQCLPDRC